MKLMSQHTLFGFLGYLVHRNRTNHLHQPIFFSLGSTKECVVDWIWMHLLKWWKKENWLN